MADLVMGAMSSLIPKLYQLLEKEYDLQTGLKERITSLTQELEIAQATLRKVALVPWDQLDEQVQIWARQVRESSYDMEDVLDTFLVRVQGPGSAEEEQNLVKHLKKMKKFFKKSKARRKISGDVMDIMTHLEEVTEWCRRYKVYDIVPTQAMTSTIDPRLAAMYTQANKLVGMDKSSGDLMSMLQNPDLGEVKMKTVSIVGVGGLGKTTLAKVVYEKIKGDFGCTAFVPVGRNPDLKKIFKDILIDLDRQKYLYISTAALDEKQFIDELRNFFLENKKRYLIVIDDIWEIESWETIKLAIDDHKNCGGRIIITTRKLEVATKADEVYKLKPLQNDRSRELLYARIYGDEGRHIDSQPDEISDKFIRKCGGIPLAIITMASLLVGKPRDKWSELYNTIDFGSKDNMEAGNTMRILSFSYYDLPSHLRTCLLYLSAFPEDSVINKGSLVWKWVAEGFVHKKQGIKLFEVGERYFNDLINRSMIQPVESYHYDGDITDCHIIGCRVHDVVLDFIRSMSREEIFFTVVDNDQDTLQQSNVRRLANHNKTIIGYTRQANHYGMAKLRSFIALECVIETWAPLSSFTLLRVLAIENCKPTDGSYVRVEHLGHLLHLRFFSLRGTRVCGILKEIGALRFLQTLDLWASEISESPSNCSLPKQLACLRIFLLGDSLYGREFSVEGMTSLEELQVTAQWPQAMKRLVKEVGSLRELRVLNADISDDEEDERDLVESLHQLHRLKSLRIYRSTSASFDEPWRARELDLPCHLRYLDVGILFRKLPSCINPCCLPSLSHLNLSLQHMDEQDLKSLGGLPELCFLGLVLLETSATISNISDSGACYFPKLRKCSLPCSMVLFVVANEGDKKSVSFHIWNGIDDIGVMPSDSDDELKRPRPPVSVQELKSSDDSLQSHKPSVCDDDELHKRRPLHKQQHGSVTALNREDPIAMPSAASDDENKEGNKARGRAAAPGFMPNLQVLHFQVCVKPGREDHLLDNLGWEYLPSVREIFVQLVLYKYDDKVEKVKAGLRCAAQVHPNRPTLHI